MATRNRVDTVHGQGGAFRPVLDMLSVEIENEIRSIEQAGYTMDYMTEQIRAETRHSALKAELKRREDEKFYVEVPSDDNNVLILQESSHGDALPISTWNDCVQRNMEPGDTVIVRARETEELRRSSDGDAIAVTPGEERIFDLVEVRYPILGTLKHDKRLKWTKRTEARELEAREIPKEGDRVIVSELSGYVLEQNRPHECRTAGSHPVTGEWTFGCKCGKCGGTTTKHPGTVIRVIHWADNSVESQVKCDDGKVRLMRHVHPHGDVC